MGTPSASLSFYQQYVHPSNFSPIVLMFWRTSSSNDSKSGTPVPQSPKTLWLMSIADGAQTIFLCVFTKILSYSQLATVTQWATRREVLDVFRSVTYVFYLKTVLYLDWQWRHHSGHRLRGDPKLENSGWPNYQWEADYVEPCVGFGFVPIEIMLGLELAVFGVAELLLGGKEEGTNGSVFFLRETLF